MIPVAATAAASAAGGRYIHWGVLNVSLTNLLIVVAMVVLFVLALVVPFGGGGHRHAPSTARHTRRERRP